ncbi:hypothetical protein MX659_07635 [Coriobacteriia bacterium Es71-Z0120]|uniref:CD3072 family TudS-related putative desulfidase n=1 Tax=Parvivirga hydrogeniphila TaxID=2939460 RepID=UPI002260CD1E|nr:CD3072 family TudS-related putative desulfidase [Parvivirga hydrogeniphila]MCL4079453.1 hypothetical protein [Parvivirga hydrogeniphila]
MTTEDAGRNPVDSRSRRIVFVCHCLLNANSKVEGLAQYAGVHPLIAQLAALGLGIIQMPCPEIRSCGMSRWGQTREQYENVPFRGLCARLADEVLAQVQEYRRCGYEILGVVGVDGSPTCGVTKSASGHWGGEYAPAEWAEVVSRVESAPLPGVYIEALLERLEPLGIRFFAIDESVEGHRVDEVIRGLTATE